MIFYTRSNFGPVVAGVHDFVKATDGFEPGPVLIGIVVILCARMAVPEATITVINTFFFAFPGLKLGEFCQKDHNHNLHRVNAR